MSDENLAIIEEKKRLRTLAKAQRRGLTIEWSAATEEALTNTALDLINKLQPSCVAGYIAMHGEVDVQPIIEAVHAQAIATCLPVIESADSPLIFREWKPDDALTIGSHHTRIPERKSRVRKPTLLLVPLLAYDRHGTRLGYGGGYYDRTIEAMRAKGDIHAYGVAMRGQRSHERLPLEETDAPLDGIITEVGLEQFRH